eukprot:2555413-Prymnesium_polylepis.1
MPHLTQRLRHEGRARRRGSRPTAPRLWRASRLGVTWLTTRLTRPRSFWSCSGQTRLRLPQGPPLWPRRRLPA